MQGKDSEAEPLHQRALQLREALLGSTHPDVATSLEFLARMALQSGTRNVESSDEIAVSVVCLLVSENWRWKGR